MYKAIQSGMIYSSKRMERAQTFSNRELPEWTGVINKMDDAAINKSGEYSIQRHGVVPRIY